jgi:hypothetical protein
MDHGIELIRVQEVGELTVMGGRHDQAILRPGCDTTRGVRSDLLDGSPGRQPHLPLLGRERRAERANRGRGLVRGRESQRAIATQVQA